MKVEPDLFDILAISLREDSYTSLIESVFDRHRNILNDVFEKLTKHKILDVLKLEFRKGWNSGASKDRPDLVIEARTIAGTVRLVIEVKIQSGEGTNQTVRYQMECTDAKVNRKCAEFHLVFLTLDGSGAIDGEFRSMKHVELVRMIDEADIDQSIARDEILAKAWKSFRERLEHYKQFPAPNDATPLQQWILAPDEYFVTRRERCAKLTETLRRSTQEIWAGIQSNRGGQQLLIILTCFKSKKWTKTGNEPLENCVHVHFELSIPLSSNPRSAAVTCHLHCETNPYLRKKEIHAKGMNPDKYLSFAKAFRRRIHANPPSGGWIPSNKWLQIAYLKWSLAPSTTIGELRSFLNEVLMTARHDVCRALELAGQECGLEWAGTIEAKAQLTQSDTHEAK